MITGFPSPAQGYEDASIDLNELLIKHPAATVFMRIESSRYTRAGMFPGDLLVVDRSLDPEHAAVIVCESEGQFVLGSAANVAEDAIVCGVVTHVIHTVRDGTACRNCSLREPEDGGSGSFPECEGRESFQKRGGEEGRTTFRTGRARS